MQSRRAFLSQLTGAAVAPIALRAAAKRPNIVLILADDMGFSDIGCYGSEIETPNLDRLAQRGVRFTHFYNNARCCPTRASLMTGLYPHQAGVGHMTGDYKVPAYRGELNDRCVTIAEALRPAGYHTLMTGKWHVTPYAEAHKYDWPLQRGFEHYFGTVAGAGSYFDPFSLQRDNEPVKPDKSFYYTDAIGDQAASFVTEYANKPDPFFLYSAFTAPHWPLHALESDVAKYKDRYRGGWDDLRAERHRKQIEAGIVRGAWPLTARDEQVPAWPDEHDKEWQARRMAVYAAQIDRLDRNIGTIIAALEKTSAIENTLILFLSDNGGCAEVLKPGMKSDIVPTSSPDGKPVRAGNDPLITPGGPDTYESYGIGWANASNTPFRLYKHWVHEGGISTPLIAHWPAGLHKPAGSFVHTPGHITDVMATCLEVSGAQYPSRAIPHVGRSVLGSAVREEICWEHEGNRAIRRGKWKLVSRYPDKWELYDLDADRTELHDMMAKQSGIAADLAKRWTAWADRVGVVPWQQLEPNRKDA